MNQESDSELTNVNSFVTVKRITAIWALSETTFGGLLHALHMPFTGIFIGGAAVIFITLIAYFSEQKYSIIKATIIVLILKGLVSPYTPIAAYFSVLLQGILGQILFINKKHISLSAFVLSVSTLLLFGFQKVIILTVVFGNTLWQSIDAFANLIVDQFHLSGQNQQTIHFSIIIISAYVFLHLAAGIFIGILAGRIPQWITTSVNKNNYYIKDINPEIGSDLFFVRNKNNKRSGKKKRAVLLVVIIVGALIVSYLIPGIGSNLFADIAIMTFRAIIITLFWYFYLAPLLIRYSKRFLRKRENYYADEVKEIIELFPQMKNILLHCWNRSSRHKGLRKYRHFLSYSLITMLFTNFNFE
jgi:hypothetical protein